MNWLVFFCMTGVCLSVYAIHVEHQSSMNPDFEALCDISSTVSCSKVFNSEQGKIWSYFGLIPKDSVLDQPNAVYGVFFYLSMIILDIGFHKNKLAVFLLLSLAIFGCMMSLYLAYVLEFVLKDFCIVCVSTYVCNIVLLFGSISRFAKIRTITTESEKKEK